MRANKKTVLDENEAFYGDLYQKRNPLVHLIRMTISFDQQSKARINRAFLKPYMKKTMSVKSNTDISLLDYGSGWGAFLMKMPRRFQLYCFDLSSQAMASICTASRYLGYGISPATVKDSELAPKGLDFIICSHVLEHVQDDGEILKLFHKALDDDGILLINVPINESWHDPKHLRTYTKDSTIGLLNLNGFAAVAEMEADKWTGFLLDTEMVAGSWRISRLFCRGVRAMLAILPSIFTRISESLFFRSRKNTQLLIISKKIR